MAQKKPRNQTIFRNRPLAEILLVTLMLMPSKFAFSSDFKVGVAVGFGGSGISDVATVNSQSVPVQRSEGPGTFTLFSDYLISDFYSVGFFHSRGFRLGPFSSGVSFTGIFGQWYFSSPSPSSVHSSPTETTLLIKRFSPFLGLATGLATGDISRSHDQIADVNNSGIFIGYKAGADYPLSSGLGFRPEIQYSMTLMSPGQLTEFSIQAGVFLFL